MAIKIMADSGGTITYTAAEIGAAWNTFANNKDYIITGCGNEMNIGYSANSLVVTIASGKAVICGRAVSLTGSESITIPANKTSGVYLVLRADLTKPVGAEGSIECLDSESAIQSANLNNLNGKHDLRLFMVKTNGQGVIECTDQRVKQNAAVDVDAINAQINAKMAEVDAKIAQLDGKVTAINPNSVLDSITLSNGATVTLGHDGIAHFHYLWSRNVYPLYIDGVYIGHMGSNVETSTACMGSSIFLPVKAGTTVQGWATQVTVYGVK